MGGATHNVDTVADRTFLQCLLLSGGKHVLDVMLLRRS